MRVAVVGGVASTEVLVQALVSHRVGEIAVWGYEPADTTLVSGWRDLRRLADELRLPFDGFRKVTNCASGLREFSPDILFVVGLSQIVPPDLLNIATKINVGFHPTALPRGRGRAALAWLILEGENGAATFFELRNKVDSGPIFEQEPYYLADNSDVADVELKMLEAERLALNRWLPRLVRGELNAVEQNHDAATYFGRRTPDDGWINWRATCDDLLRLIRASAPPHPGAYTFCDRHKIEILKARASERQETGVPGRILMVHEQSDFEVQVGDGIIHVSMWHSKTGWIPKVGSLLGYYAEAEIFMLKARVGELERSVQKLLDGSDKHGGSNF